MPLRPRIDSYTAIINSTHFPDKNLNKYFRRTAFDNYLQNKEKPYDEYKKQQDEQMALTLKRMSLLYDMYNE